MPLIDNDSVTINAVSLTEQGSDPATPATGKWKIFTKSDGLYLIDDAGTVTGPFAEAIAASAPPYVCMTHEAATNTAGGTFTSGAWRTRPMTTEQSDTDNIASIASNQITLAAGVYECRIVSNAYFVGAHQAKLYDTTGAADILLGTVGYAAHDSVYGGSASFISGKFTLSVESVLEIRHWCATSENTDGFGLALTWGAEVYAIAEFWKVG